MKDVSEYKFQNLDKSENEHISRNMDMLKNIDIPYTVKVGSGKMKFKDIQDISSGTIIPLNIEEGSLFPLVIGEGEGQVIFYGYFIVTYDGMLSFQVKEISKK